MVWPPRRGWMGLGGAPPQWHNVIHTDQPKLEVLSVKVEGRRRPLSAYISVKLIIETDIMRRFAVGGPTAEAGVPMTAASFGADAPVCRRGKHRPRRAPFAAPPSHGCCGAHRRGAEGKTPGGRSGRDPGRPPYLEDAGGGRLCSAYAPAQLVPGGGNSVRGRRHPPTKGPPSSPPPLTDALRPS